MKMCMCKVNIERKYMKYFCILLVGIMGLLYAVLIFFYAFCLFFSEIKLILKFKKRIKIIKYFMSEQDYPS